MSALSAAFALAFGVSLTAKANIVSALNVANGTYTFYATDGNTGLDGSWVEFNNDQIISWDLVDPLGVAGDQWALNYYGPNYAQYLAPLTPGNSAVENVMTYAPGYLTGPNAFSFTIGSPANSPGAVWYFSGDNNLNGGTQYSALFDGDPLGAVTDPYGNWDYTGAGGSFAGVPDGVSTAALLVGAVALMEVGRRMMRNRK